jgi:hypothetical protein
MTIVWETKLKIEKTMLRFFKFQETSKFIFILFATLFFMFYSCTDSKNEEYDYFKNRLNPKKQLSVKINDELRKEVFTYKIVNKSILDSILLLISRHDTSNNVQFMSTNLADIIYEFELESNSGYYYTIGTGIISETKKENSGFLYIFKKEGKREIIQYRFKDYKLPKYLEEIIYRN